MSSVALVPAKSRSTGIPHKNFRLLGGRLLFAHAIDCADAAGVDAIVVSTDAPEDMRMAFHLCTRRLHGAWHLPRPSALCQDDTPMFDVVQHAVDTLQLEDEDILVLLQPTQPFRKPEHVQKAIQLLQETQADSVVSVVELPRTHHPDYVCRINDGWLVPHEYPECRASWDCGRTWDDLPTRRQDVEPAYIRDGTVYAFWVKTLRSGTIYGSDVRPLIIPPEDTCELDTEQDWQAVEARWRQSNPSRI